MKVLVDMLDMLMILEIIFEVGVLVVLDGELFNLVDLIIKLDQIVGEYGIGWIDYIENWLVGIKLWEVYEVLVVMVLFKVYKDLEDLMFECELVYFKLIIE